MKKMGEETRGGRGRRHFGGCGDADGGVLRSAVRQSAGFGGAAGNAAGPGAGSAGDGAGAGAAASGGHGAGEVPSADPGACLSPGGILIVVYNALLEEPAAEKECLYLNVAEAVTVKNDCLRKELISDGIHLHTAECVEWREYLKAHPVEKGL